MSRTNYTTKIKPRAAAMLLELARAEGRFLSIWTLAEAAGFPERDYETAYCNNGHTKASAKAGRILWRLGRRYPGTIQARHGIGGYRLRPGALRTAAQR